MRDVSKAHDELVAVIHWIDERSRVIVVADELGPKAAAACLDMALEHQAAIAALAEKDLYGSANSLLRSEIEALVRGMWCWRCARKKDIERFRARDRLPVFGELIEAVERKLGQGASALSRMKRQHWEALCSFTHTGFQQIARRYTAGHLVPNYPEADRIRTLKFATAGGLLVAMELAGLSGNREAEREVLERCRLFTKGQK